MEDHYYRFHYLMRLYFNVMFRIAGWLFIRKRCPTCGAKLRYNHNGRGEAGGLYCPRFTTDWRHRYYEDIDYNDAPKFSWTWRDLDK